MLDGVHHLPSRPAIKTININEMDDLGNPLNKQGCLIFSFNIRTHLISPMHSRSPCWTVYVCDADLQVANEQDLVTINIKMNLIRIKFYFFSI